MSDAIYIAIDGQRHGPVTRDQLRDMLASGQVAGDSLCWYEGLSEWAQLSAAFPDLAPPPVAAPAATPAAAPAQPVLNGTVGMEILRTEFYQMPKITLDQAMVVVEAGAMHYMRGAISIESKVPSMGGLLKSKLTGEKLVRPEYSGTGEIYLEPTFGEVGIFDPAGETWILDRGAFLAGEATVEIGAFTNKAITGLFGGEGFFQTQISGRGQVMYTAPGPVERLELVNDTLVVDGSFAVARTASLEYRVERATKGFLSSLTSGEGIVNTFRGTGTVLIAPVPNRFMTLLREFGGLRSLIRGMSKG
jgi:uncharacterized protein (TIGR00266 family)